MLGLSTLTFSINNKTTRYFEVDFKIPSVSYYASSKALMAGQKTQRNTKKIVTHTITISVSDVSPCFGLLYIVLFVY